MEHQSAQTMRFLRLKNLDNYWVPFVRVLKIKNSKKRHKRGDSFEYAIELRPQPSERHHWIGNLWMQDQQKLFLHQEQILFCIKSHKLTFVLQHMLHAK